MTLEDLINLLRKFNYSEDEIKRIDDAYKYANMKHGNQVRQSGEPYITHPLHVAYTLVGLHADVNTIIAALLHDVLEDTKTEKEEITKNFNEEVANLVDGVTNLSDKDYSSREMAKKASTRKLLVAATNDVRIIIIKLADRLHNMQTLQFKSPEKQQEKAHETLDIFVPTASKIGTYELQRNLEDLSFKYLNPDQYHIIGELKMNFAENNAIYVDELMKNCRKILLANGLTGSVDIRERNLYSLYNKIRSGFKPNDIHDILAVKVVLKQIKDCTDFLEYLKKSYRFFEEEYRDYISNPKPNLYQSIHASWYLSDDKIFQTRIRTRDMDLIANRGIAAYWDLDRDNARTRIQSEFETKLRLYKNVKRLNSMFPDDAQFFDSLKSDVLSPPISVHALNGDLIELPNGATPIDFAYQIHKSLGDSMVAATVNGEFVPVGCTLKNDDAVRIIVNKTCYAPKYGWDQMAVTSYARQRIREYNRKFQKKG
jgi:GTP pyrophosphokinase